MPRHRVFLSQETLDRWLSEEKIEVDGEIMMLRADQQKFHLATAVHFLKEVAEGNDPHDLVGKVKDLEQITAMGAEHCSDSVIFGDHAYEVIEGFLGGPMQEAAESEDRSVASGEDLAAAARAAMGEERSASGEYDLLARFFLDPR